MDKINMIRDINNLLGDPANIEYMLRDISKSFAAILFLFNTIQCFFGYKLTKLWISVSGFFLFGMIGFIVGIGVSGDGDSALAWALIFAIIGAVISFNLYKIGIFILGFLSGVLLGYILIASVAAAILLGTIIGVLAVIFMKPVIILSTSISAGLMAGSNLLAIFDYHNDGAAFMLGIIYALCGIMAQWMTNTKSSNKENINSEVKEKVDDIRNNVYQNEKQFKETAGKIVSQVNAEFNDKILEAKERILREQMEVEERTKGLSVSDILSELQVVLYSNKICGYAISFCEYIMYSLVGIELITFVGELSYSYILRQISLIAVIISMIIGCLCIIRNKYVPPIAYFSTTCITYLIKIINGYGLVITYLGIIIIMLTIDACLIKFYFKSEEGRKLKKYIANIGTVVKSAEKNKTTVIMIRCPKCGAVCSEDANFCIECGEALKKNIDLNNISATESSENQINEQIRNNNNIEKTVEIDKTIIMNKIEEKIIENSEDNYKLD